MFKSSRPWYKPIWRNWLVPKVQGRGHGGPSDFFPLLGTLWGTLFGASRAKDVSLLSPPPPRQGVWAATATVTLVRRESGDLHCCMLTP